MRRRYALALDLKDDPELIERYEWYHSPEGIWPEVLANIRESGIELMEIYRTGNRLLMILEVDANFSFEAKDRHDAANPKVQEWEALMDQFQARLPWARPGEKWVLMEKIFTTSGSRESSASE
jgi:L-rhamnose mutarotase